MPLHYAYTDDMAEITGLGDGHDAPAEFSGWDEATARAMVLAGVDWFEQQAPAPDPQFRQSAGVMLPDNEAAYNLTKAMHKAVGGIKIPMAIFHDCVGHVFAILQHGWEEYARQMRAAKEAAHGENV